MLLLGSLATPAPDNAALIADGVAEPPDAWIQMRSDGVVPVAWIQAWLRRPSQDSDFLSNATQMRVTQGQVEAESVGMRPQLSIMAHIKFGWSSEMEGASTEAETDSSLDEEHISHLPVKDACWVPLTQSEGTQ